MWLPCLAQLKASLVRALYIHERPLGGGYAKPRHRVQTLRPSHRPPTGVIKQASPFVVRMDGQASGGALHPIPWVARILKFLPRMPYHSTAVEETRLCVPCTTFIGPLAVGSRSGYTILAESQSWEQSVTVQSLGSLSRVY